MVGWPLNNVATLSKTCGVLILEKQGKISQRFATNSHSAVLVTPFTFDS